MSGVICWLVEQRGPKNCPILLPSGCRLDPGVTSFNLLHCPSSLRSPRTFRTTLPASVSSSTATSHTGKVCRASGTKTWMTSSDCLCCAACVSIASLTPFRTLLPHISVSDSLSLRLAAFLFLPLTLHTSVSKIVLYL